jgi:hypothetical protein
MNRKQQSSLHITGFHTDGHNIPLSQSGIKRPTVLPPPPPKPCKPVPSISITTI